MSSGVELHDHLIIPLGKLLSNKVINTSYPEALMNMGEVVFIGINILPIHPSHVTDDWLLIKQDSLIEVLLFSGLEAVITSSPPPCSIWI